VSRADLLALGAIVLWASLASLATGLAHVPPFLLTGLGLLVGGLMALPMLRRYPLGQLLQRPMLWVGVGGLFGYHFLLFMALRYAPAVEANLVNYLWPLGIVVLAPLVLPGMRLSARHVGAGVLGFAGAALAIRGSGATLSSVGASAGIGYVLAAGAALTWSLYSLITRRLGDFPTAAVGAFALISGLLALGCHVLFEPRVSLSLNDWALIALLGIGPLGGAFYLWDAALKCGDAQRIGLLSFLTPILSTALLLVVTGQPLRAHIGLAAAMVIGAALWGSRAPPLERVR
jgi:drug/metabolite transporter (DMT)-like permease